MPAVAFSTYALTAAAVLLPAPWGIALLVAAVSLIGAAAAGLGEGALVRAVLVVRPLSTAPPSPLAVAMTVACSHGVDLGAARMMVGPGRRPAATPFGRRTIVVTQGLLDAADAGMPPDQVAAVLAEATGRAQTGQTRYQAARLVATIPWSIVRAVVAFVGLPLRQLRPLFQLGWVLRPVVVTVAIVQCIAQGHPGFAVAIAGLLAYTYARPLAITRLRRDDQARADRWVTQHQLHNALAAHLRRTSTSSPAATARADRLSPPPQQSASSPRLALVSTTTSTTAGDARS